MRDALALLWRARLAVAAGLLAISAAAIVRGHHDAWAGDKTYTASLTDDVLFVGSTALAFVALWIGAYAPAYVLCLCLFFAYQAILNVTTLLAGGFVIRGEHGCADCTDNAQLFVSGMLDYVFAGLLATAAARAIASRSLPQPPDAARANLAFLILLPVAWFKHTFFLDALSQSAYVAAQLQRLAPYIAAALLSAVITASISVHYGACQEKPRHTTARFAAVIFLFIGLPLLELLFAVVPLASAGAAALMDTLAHIVAQVSAGFSR
jgi:hypothetical protein